MHNYYCILALSQIFFDQQPITRSQGKQWFIEVFIIWATRSYVYKILGVAE